MEAVTAGPTQRALVLSGGGGRGAYQAGVWRYLQEIEWVPDLVAGTSVGALNAAAIGIGWDARELSEFWQRVERHSIYRTTFRRRVIHALGRWFKRERGFTSLLDPSPLRKLLEEFIDVEELRKSPMEVVITAVNLVTARLRYFDSSVIGVDHLMASAAIPVVFPWQVLDDEPHWDGGIMANTPVLPALRSGAKEIVVVLLAPLMGDTAPLPQTRYRALEWALELSSIGSAVTAMAQFAHGTEIGDRRLAVVAPRGMLGLRSVLRFTPRESRRLIQLGYDDAREQLAELLSA